jgi:hypothetical protein
VGQEDGRSKVPTLLGFDQVRDRAGTAGTAKTAGLCNGEAAMGRAGPCWTIVSWAEPC